MHAPSVTGFYLAILALIYAVLALRVAGLRRTNRALFGDAENAGLRTAIRVHANFIEYVPIITLLVALLEISGMAASRVHLLMGGLLLSRLLHPMGMAARPGTWQFNVGRVGGILLTIAVLVAAGIGGLRLFWPS
ncbi:MAG: MAPEG family protein [Bradyrhizobium sp.]